MNLNSYSESLQETEEWWFEKKPGDFYLFKAGVPCGKIVDISPGNNSKLLKVSFN